MSPNLVDLAQKWFGRRVGNPHASLKVLAQSYGIEIETEAKPTGHLLEDNDREFTQERPSQAQLQPAYMLLRSELALYPISVVKASKLERIILCSHLRRDDVGLNGRFSCQSGSIYFSVDRIAETHLRRSFHHEFFHCIDYNDDHWRYHDPVWIRLNEPRFAYAGRPVEQQQSQFVRRIGFLTNYAMKEVWEDKAELYSHMIMHYDWVESRTMHDPILKKKFERMKELLRTFSATYDEDFWAQRQQHSVALKDDGGIIVKIKLQEKNADARRMWLLTRQDDSSIRPIELDSENMLAYCLSKLGISEFEEIDGLNGKSKKAEINVRVPQLVLKELGLS
jgi:hypothetical protein